MPDFVRWLAALRVAVAFGSLLLFVAWVLGQLLRDVSWITGICFYIPSIVVVAVGLLAAVVHLGASQRKRRSVAFACVIPPLAVVLLLDNHFLLNPPTRAPRPGVIRLMHWNSGGRLARAGIGEFLIAEQADLYALTDVPPNPAHVDQFVHRLGPDYHATMFANLAVVARGELQANGWLVNRDEFEVQSVTWTHDGITLLLFVIDIPSNVFIARDPMLRELNVLIEEHQPDLIVGDFNAPRRSWAFTQLPPGYQHAYNSVGNGWGYTWPVPLPMYSLDHCLYGPRIEPVTYRLGGMQGDSDHRYQVFEFTPLKR